MSAIADRFRSVQNELRQIAPDRQISVVGVAKHQSIETMREAVNAGVHILAHNYVQEGMSAMEALVAEPVEWHFIGHIQSRKVRELPHYHCVQSLDRLEVAQSLSERMIALTKRMRVLIEVNVGGEPQKSGIGVTTLPSFIDSLSKMPGLVLEGFMAMPPGIEPVEERRPFFRQMKELFDTYQSSHHLSVLSMGTSQDYAIAVAEGSTMIRLGTSLLGERKS